MLRTARRTLRRFAGRYAVPLAALSGLAASLVSPALAHEPDAPHPAITPSSVAETVAAGGSLQVRKTVHTPEIPAQPEVYFLVDTTGSMFGVIAQVQADIGLIIGSIQAAAPAATFGLGEYKDFPYDAVAFNHMVSIGPDDGPGGAVDVSDGVGALAASGGGDGPEGQFFALDRLASAANPAGFTPGKTNIIVWIGDAPAHDTVCSAISGLGYDITEVSLTASLQSPAWGGSGLKVVAISTLTGFPSGLDDDPAPYSFDYTAACGTPGGTAGQGTRIGAATGGTHIAGVAPDDISQAILDAVGSVQVEVAMHSDCQPPISTSFVPASQSVASGDDAVFVETIAVSADAEPGVYTCRDWATVDGEPLTGANREILYEVKRITVAVPYCLETVNPAGKNVPKAPAKGGQGQNQDGFYLIGAKPDLAGMSVYVRDDATGVEFGPYPSGTRIKYTEANGAQPSASPMAGNNGGGGSATAVAWHIKGQGDALVVFKDAFGNEAVVSCLVPPPPK